MHYLLSYCSVYVLLKLLKKKEMELTKKKAQLNHVRLKRELKIQSLKEDLCKMNPYFDFGRIEEVANNAPSDEETKSDTTDTGRGSMGSTLEAQNVWFTVWFKSTSLFQGVHLSFKANIPVG